MKCKNCGEEIRWCDGCQEWEHADSDTFSVRCLAKTVAEPEEGN